MLVFKLFLLFMAPFMSIWFLMEERENTDLQTVLKADLNDTQNPEVE